MGLRESKNSKIWEFKYKVMLRNEFCCDIRKSCKFFLNKTDTMVLEILRIFYLRVRLMQGYFY